MLKISMHAKSDPEYSYLSVAYVRDTHLAGRYQTQLKCLDDDDPASRWVSVRDAAAAKGNLTPEAEHRDIRAGLFSLMFEGRLL